MSICVNFCISAFKLILNLRNAVSFVENNQLMNRSFDQIWLERKFKSFIQFILTSYHTNFLDHISLIWYFHQFNQGITYPQKYYLYIKFSDLGGYKEQFHWTCFFLKGITCMMFDWVLSQGKDRSTQFR